MGPRMREDTGVGRYFMGAGSRGNNGRGRVWMVGVGRATDGLTLTMRTDLSLTTTERAKMGPRIREDNGGDAEGYGLFAVKQKNLGTENQRRCLLKAVR